ncbi:MAG: hypothetical protein LBQ79_07115 [Deltaproteobacteria bacterium]|nr:hypothetical protein [Deltaproteobacteria bacterium]
MRNVITGRARPARRPGQETDGDGAKRASISGRGCRGIPDGVPAWAVFDLARDLAADEGERFRVKTRLAGTPETGPAMPRAVMSGRDAFPFSHARPQGPCGLPFPAPHASGPFPAAPSPAGGTVSPDQQTVSRDRTAAPPGLRTLPPDRRTLPSGSWDDPCGNPAPSGLVSRPRLPVRRAEGFFAPCALAGNAAQARPEAFRDRT